MGDPRSLTHRHKHHSPVKEATTDENGGGVGGAAATAVSAITADGKTKPRRSRLRRPCPSLREALGPNRRRTTLAAAAVLCIAAVAFAAFAALPALAAMRIAGRLRPGGGGGSRTVVVLPRTLIAPTPWDVQVQTRRRRGKKKNKTPLYQLGRTVYHPKRADSQRLVGNEYHFETDDCVAMREWQTIQRPTCNSVHEVAISEMDGDAELVNGGDYRDVWRIYDYDMETKRAFKSMQFERHEDGHKVYEMMRAEAIAMDHLTKSPYVMSLHGFCALAALYPFSSGGTFKRAAKKGFLSSEQKLELALHVARATRDVHDIDDEAVVTMTCADISSGQFVENDETGIYQLADLNVLHFMTWDKETHEPCPFKEAPSAGYVRSPEEYARAEGFDEGIDIWAMGNVLHFLLTGHYAMSGSITDWSRNKVVSAVKKGVRPPSYDRIEKEGDPVEMEILHVVKNTRTTEKEDRWPAKRAVEYLEMVQKKVKAGEIKGRSAKNKEEPESES